MLLFLCTLVLQWCTAVPLLLPSTDWSPSIFTSLQKAFNGTDARKESRQSVTGSHRADLKLPRQVDVSVLLEAPPNKPYYYNYYIIY